VVLEDGLLLRQALVAIRVALHLLLEVAVVVVHIILLLHHLMGITMVIPTVKETPMATRLKANRVITIILPSTINATTTMARKVATGRTVIHAAAILDRGETTILAVVTKDKSFVYSGHVESWWAVDRC
jgi:hypothetical protein